MNERPQQKWELVIAIAGDELFIWPGTNDAENWIVRESLRYGRLDAALRTNSGYYKLSVSPLYDTNEVALYLARMNGVDNSGVRVMSRGQQVYPVQAD